MLTGSCMCGSVAYEVDADPGRIVHCHCATCRKAHGSAFSTVTNVPRDRFCWTKGENLIRGFESSPGKQRYFCTQCGSHIVAERAGTGNILLRMGCLDTPITQRPKVHIWRSLLIDISDSTYQQQQRLNRSIWTKSGPVESSPELIYARLVVDPRHLVSKCLSDRNAGETHQI